MFPNGVVFLPDHLADGYLGATDRKAFLEQNADELRTFRDGILGGSPAARFSYVGHYIVLGCGSVVRCVGHEQETLADGTIVNRIHMQTTSSHVFDGSFAFGWRTLPGTKNAVVWSGLQSGKHPIVVVDELNVTAGPFLIDYGNRASGYVLAAMEAGAPFTANRDLIKDWTLWTRGTVLEALDRFSPLVQWVRGQSGPCTMAEIDADVLAQITTPDDAHRLRDDDLPTPPTSGISVDDTAIVRTDNPFWPPPDPPASQSVGDALDHALAYQLTQSNYDALRAEVVSYATQQLGSDWADLSSSELIGRLLGDEWSLQYIRSLVQSVCLDRVLPQVQAVIDTLTAGADERQRLNDYVLDRFGLTVTSPLLTERGALRVAVQLEILDQQVRLVDAGHLDDEISSAATAKANAESKLEELRAEKPANDEERQRLEAEIETYEDQREDAERREERYREQRGDVENAGARRSTYDQDERTSRDATFSNG